MTTGKLAVLLQIALLCSIGLCSVGSCLAGTGLASGGDSPDPTTRTPLLPGTSTRHTVGIFYSFDSKPEPGLSEQMQGELRRILSPSGVAVSWHLIDENHGNEIFAEVLVIRFRGSCELPSLANQTRMESWGAHELADTRRSDGKVLPFAEVQCDELRRYLGPTVASERASVRRTLLGRAMARVAAHEIFHMLTGSTQHSKQGIARATHSRRDLTAERFDFDPVDTEWLRTWRGRALAGGDEVAAAEGSPLANSENTGEVLR